MHTYLLINHTAGSLELVNQERVQACEPAAIRLEDEDGNLLGLYGHELDGICAIRLHECMPVLMDIPKRMRELLVKHGSAVVHMEMQLFKGYFDEDVSDIRLEQIPEVWRIGRLLSQQDMRDHRIGLFSEKIGRIDTALVDEMEAQHPLAELKVVWNYYCTHLRHPLLSAEK